LGSVDSDSFWRGRRVLATGAGGFIGSHLVELLVRDGAEVRAFVRYNSRNDHGLIERLPGDVRDAVEVFVGDIANPEAVIDAVTRMDTVLHLAALIPIPYSYRHPREFVTANLVGTMNVLEAARRQEIRRLVQVSTSEVYGTAQNVPIREDHRLHPQSPYAATKVGSDQLALSYQRSFGLPVVLARPFNTFGPRQSARAVIPAVISQALTRDVIELGATSPTRDFTYVSDTAAGLARCAEVEGAVGDVINLGTGVETSIGEVVERVLGILGKEVPVRTDEARIRPPESEVERLVADVTLAKQLLGWQASVSLQEGLELTVAEVAASIETFKPTIYNV